MKMPRLPKKSKSLDLEIERAIKEMAKMDVQTEQYAQATANLKSLFESKSLESKWTISPDMVLGVGANLLGILLILNYERLGIITSKAITFLPRKM